MHKLVIIDDVNNIEKQSFYPLLPVDKFNSRDKIVDKNGRSYKIVDKREREFFGMEFAGRILLGSFAVLFSLGFALLSKKVVKLFKGKMKIHFAIPFQVNNNNSINKDPLQINNNSKTNNEQPTTVNNKTEPSIPIASKTQEKSDTEKLETKNTDDAKGVDKKDVISAAEKEQKRKGELIEEIRHELQQESFGKVIEKIQDYSTLSLKTPAEYLPVHAEILKTLAGKLHKTLKNKKSWDKTYSKVDDIIWKISDFNPSANPEYDSIRNTVINLKKELTQVNVEFKRLNVEYYHAKSINAIQLRKYQEQLNNPSITDQEYKKEIAKNIKDLHKEFKEKAEGFNKRGKELSDNLLKLSK